jgi:hypothetical protein
MRVGHACPLDAVSHRKVVAEVQIVEPAELSPDLVFAGQQRGAVFEAHRGGRRLGVVALAGPAGGGGDWASSSWSIPIASVVPVSL